ncbi:MAG: hypothetical protein AB1746_16520 [Candidatus Zixiibacteriota bacterium]
MKNQLLMVVFFIAVCPVISQSEMLVMKSRQTVEALGMGGLESNVTTYMSTFGSREEKTGKKTGIMAMMGDYFPGVDGMSLTRLDKGLAWFIDSLGECQEKELSKYKPSEEDTSMAKYEIFKTAESKRADSIVNSVEWITTIDSSDTVETVNGFPCRMKSCRSVTTNSDNSKEELIFSYKLWYCSEVPGADIYHKYQSEFNRLTGFDDDLALADLAKAMGAIGVPLTEITKMNFRAEGIPIKTVMDFMMSPPDTSESEGKADSLDISGMDDDQSENRMVQMASFFKSMMKPDENGMWKVMSNCVEYLGISVENSNDSLFAPPPGCEE